MSRLHFHPIQGQAKSILQTILHTPEISACRLKDLLAVRLVCEEVVVNIVSYAYPEGEDGFLDVDIQSAAVSEPTDNAPDDAPKSAPDGRLIVIRFEDGGAAFNPLEKEDPDTALSWQQRRIGGLGIFLIRRKVHAVSYDYVDQRNILTITLRV